MGNVSLIIDKVLIILHPPLKISNAAWLKLWVEKEKNSFVKTASITWIIFALIYVLHFFFVDLPLQKKPIELWAKYRFGLSFICLITVYFTNSKYLNNMYYYRIPAILTGFVCSYYQAQSMIWRAEVPYFFAIVVPICATLALNTSVFISVFYLFFSYSLGFEAWLFREQDYHMLISSGMVGLVFIGVIRSRMTNDVSLFLSEQTELQTREKLIEKQQEMNDQIKSFLPKKTFKNLMSLIVEENISIVQAIDEVMRPKKTYAVCFYSDIRGFTKQVKEDKNYILNSVLPSQKSFNDIIQEYDGITKNTGDLVFAFFEDEVKIKEIITNALECSVELIRKQFELNLNTIGKEQIKRHILLSFGPGIVGNTGGIDGSREIGIFGDCANILSRLDEITKHESLKNQISDNSILITQEMEIEIKNIFPKLKLREINLKKINLSIRNFPEQERIYILNYENVVSAIRNFVK